MTYNNAKQYWKFFKSITSDAQHQNWIKTIMIKINYDEKATSALEDVLQWLNQTNSINIT